MIKNQKTFGAIVLLFTTIIWGLAYSQVQAALNAGWGIFPILFVRTTIAHIVLFFFIIKKGLKGNHIFIKGALCGLCSFLGLTLQSVGQNMSSISTTSFLTSLYLVFTPLIASFLNKTKENFYIYICIIFSIIGCFLINMKLPFSFDQDNFFGNLLVTIGALMFALQIVFITKFTQDNDAMVLTYTELVFMSLYSLAGMFIFNDFSVNISDTYSVVNLVLLGVFSSGFASFFQMFGNKRLPESVSGIIQSLESVTALFFAMIIYKETLDIIKIIGCVLIVLSALFGSIKTIKNKKEIKYEL